MKAETCFSCRHFILSEVPYLTYICNAKNTIHRKIDIAMGVAGYCRYYFAKDHKDIFAVVHKIANNGPTKSRLT